MYFFQFIKHNRASLMALWVLLFIFIFFELWYNTKKNDIKPSTLLPVIPQAIEGALHKKPKQQVLALYEKFDMSKLTEEEQEHISNNAMTEKAQSQQQGELSAIYIGENKYNLIGVYGNHKDSNAILLVTNTNTNTKPVKIVHFALNSMVGDWHLTSIKKNSIKFTNNKQVVTLHVFTLKNIDNENI